MHNFHHLNLTNISSGGQYELLDWLNNVTFPTESRFADVDFAKRVYTSVVERVLNFGTTTCCYYGSLHLEATKILADIVHERGQRAFVGVRFPSFLFHPSSQQLISHV